MDAKEIYNAILGIGENSPWEIAEHELIKNKEQKGNKSHVYIKIRYKPDSLNVSTTANSSEKQFNYSILETIFTISIIIPSMQGIFDQLNQLIMPWQLQENNISQKLHNKINEKFELEINKRIKKGHATPSPFRILGERFKTKNFTAELFSIVPEILCGYFAGNIQQQKVILVTPDHIGDLEERSGILLCHSLSPFSESVGFYGEMGRAFRLAKGLNLKIQVLLAEEDWGKLNWVARDLKLEDNLSPNERWRKMVYGKLGITVDSCNINQQIKEEADEYVEIVKKIWGDDVVNKRFTKEEAREKLNQADTFFYSDIPSLSSSLKTYKTTIACVLNKFLRVDKTTFTYFMAQYHHQIKYNGWFKVSIEREQDFDESFKEISESKKVNKSNSYGDILEHKDLVSLYFEDYVYGTIIDNDKPVSLTAHPYYFPSANIFYYYKNDLSSAKENCLMIYDIDVVKIEKHLIKMNSFQKGRLIADLLSFAHMLSDKDKEIKKTINNWMLKVDESKSLSNSWIKYTDSRNDFYSLCKSWGEVVFTAWNNNEHLIMPYHFLPFLWSEFVSVKNESELIRSILMEAKRLFNPPYPNLITDPTKKIAIE